MRRNIASRYARWPALAAAIIAASVAGLYLKRSAEERHARQELPAAVPPAVQQQSAGFSFSKVEGDRTVFTVRASKATQYNSEDGRSLLEDVWVTVYGHSGERFDNLRTRSCEYMADKGNIRCAGQVQIDLESGSDAKRAAESGSRPGKDAEVVHVKTSGVTFDQNSGEAATDQKVTFVFPGGEGQGVGFRYDSKESEIRLLRDTRLVFHPRNASVSAAQSDDPADLHVNGGGLTYFRDRFHIELLGPVSAEQRERHLSAEKLDVELDPQLRARRIIATGMPMLTETTLMGSRTVSGTELTANLSEMGWVEEAVAQGSAQLESKGGLREDRLDGDRVVMQFQGSNNSPRKLIATGRVRVRSEVPGGATRTLQTQELTLDFAAGNGGKGAQVERATTPAAAVDVRGSVLVGGQTTPDQIHLTSQHLQVDFSDGNQVRQIDGAGGVEIQRQVGSQPLQVSSSREMVAHFASGGGWTTVDQTGDVCVTQGDDRAMAQQAHLDHDSDTVRMKGSVAISDRQSRTTADSASLDRAKDQFVADGHVTTTDLGEASSASPPTASLSWAGTSRSRGGLAHVLANHMVADTMNGHAVYSGSARLWQDDSIIEGDTIDFDRPTQTAVATGHVRAVLPPQQSAQQTAEPEAPGMRTGQKQARDTAQDYWHVQAERMRYARLEGRGWAEGNVSAQSSQGKIRADRADLFFEPKQPTERKGSSSANPPEDGQEQLKRMVAEGHVIIDQDDREATADQADYTIADGRILLSGGPPKVRDASGNVTTGRELTFNFHDDTINIDSAKGMRTLTLHRVEK